ADRNRSHWSTSKTPSYTKSVSWQHHRVSLEGHAGRKLTAEMARNYDLILAMESEHIAQVTAIAPEVRGKTMLFGQWLEQKEIPDPYRKSQDAFEHVYGMLERASQEWAKRLSR
ncbi:hypothetical protein ACK6WA_03925, partial [Escherichia coli]